jgi:hypothetical protein
MLMPLRVRAASDSDTKTGETQVSNWLEVSDLDPRPSRIIPVQSIGCKAVLQTSFDWKTEPVEYFHLFFDLALLDLILQETSE